MSTFCAKCVSYLSPGLRISLSDTTGACFPLVFCTQNVLLSGDNVEYILFSFNCILTFRHKSGPYYFGFACGLEKREIV